MSDKEKVVPPVLPKEPTESKGLWGGFFGKKKTDDTINMLKEEIEKDRPVPPPPVQEAPLPPDTNKEAKKDDLPLPPDEIMHEERKAGIAYKEREPAPPPVDQPDTRGLEDHLKTLHEGIEPKHKLVTFTIMGGKHAITISDLVKAIKQMTPEQFLEHQEAGDFTAWIKLNLFDAELALKVGQAEDKKEAIDIIEEALKPKTPSKGKTHPPTPISSAEQRFEKLKNKQEEQLAELQEAVSKKTTADMKREELDKHLTKKDGTLAQSLYDLVRSFELMDNITYHNIITNHKDELAARIAELAQEAAGISRIGPIELQAKILKELQAGRQALNDQFDEQRKVLEEEAKELVEQEDELYKREEEIEKARKALGEEEERFLQQKEQWAEDIREREATISLQESAAADFVKEQEAVVAGLKEQEEELKKEEEDSIQHYEQRRAELNEIEAGIAVKKKESEQSLVDREASADKREQELKMKESLLESDRESFEADKRSYEEQMQKRERIVQDTVDKIIAIDNDIISQRKQIDEMKQDIDNEGFQKYLKHELKKVKTDHIVLNTIKQPKPSKGDEFITKKIDECSAAIENKDFATAKRLYASLKNMHEEAKLDGREKEMIFDAIRELYADLHLAMLNQH